MSREGLGALSGHGTAAQFHPTGHSLPVRWNGPATTGAAGIRRIGDLCRRVAGADIRLAYPAKRSGKTGTPITRSLGVPAVAALRAPP